ncbi:hypothetical protein LOTGIDRAFT_171448 [Lottia gigantea]|uniref:Uncharacterized protein n=1 Tax=Lottia gigantea TaxID=225164 RepID=V4B064_LOTGI|nr:hypothetical protein LOTGIDRAFT_171448 [Lottia gigantea]XP_009050067.1 hypothetical protein LOTGIDRAFT_177073 [Lottia gigantea]ESO99245.1 hypothetical protein LOTGIDRAFT_177073 [Lottia gigantea]ESP03363.1 hypothetical protein LOTGIDRAFT_171448 [Lottia gigantea]
MPTKTDTVWQYKAPCKDTPTTLQRLTNEKSECSIKDYPYGWGLRAGQTGCCGNYPGCCKFASILCWFHDIACTCCGSIWCGPQCQNDPSCHQMLSDSAVDEGSGEI